jgi:hypothetical protein
MLLADLLRKLDIVKKYDLVFTAGEVINSANQYTMKKVKINLCDYENFRKASVLSNKIISGKYAVFLDINLPYHSDHIISKTPAINSAPYFKSLNIYFSYLERAYDLEVVIAAHPDSEYDSLEFGGRKICKLKTAELVKDSEFVISHASNSLSYAVLNFKPILFVYTEEMYQLYKNTLIAEMKKCAHYFEVQLLNIDKIVDESQIKVNEVNISIYNKYKYDFLTSPTTENLNSGDIFIQEINNL